MARTKCLDVWRGKEFRIRVRFGQLGNTRGMSGLITNGSKETSTTGRWNLGQRKYRDGRS